MRRSKTTCSQRSRRKKRKRSDGSVQDQRLEIRDHVFQPPGHQRISQVRQLPTDDTALLGRNHKATQVSPWGGQLWSRRRGLTGYRMGKQSGVIFSLSGILQPTYCPGKSGSASPPSSSLPPPPFPGNGFRFAALILCKRGFPPYATHAQTRAPSAGQSRGQPPEKTENFSPAASGTPCLVIAMLTSRTLVTLRSSARRVGEVRTGRLRSDRF